MTVGDLLADQLAAAAIMAAARRPAMAGPVSSRHMIYVIHRPASWTVTL
jgi:hypothetical protein